MREMRQSKANFGDLFFREPEGTSLRGDTDLWAKMRTTLADEPLPPNEEALASKVGVAFRTLTGKSLEKTTKPFFVARLASGGMSSGHVDPGWWRDQAISQLKTRLSALHTNSARFSELLEIVLLERNRRLPSDALDDFIADAARELAILADTARWVKEQMPEGWEEQYEGARRGLESLARAMRCQTPWGRRSVLRQAILSKEGVHALGKLGSDEGTSNWDSTLDTVITLLFAAAETPGMNAYWYKNDRAEQISQVVGLMANLWRYHLGIEPKASHQSPFSSVVIAIWAEMSEEEPLSHQAVKRALENLNP